MTPKLYRFLLVTQIVIKTSTCDNANKEEQSCEKDSCNNSCLSFNHRDHSVIIKDSDGRLGNHMFSYLFLLQLKMKFGYKTYITQKTHSYLSPLFANLNMDIAEEVLCDFNETYAKYRNKIREQRMKIIVEVIESRLGHKVDLKRDEFGRWKISEEILLNPKVKVDQIVHSADFNIVADVSVPKSSYPWEPFAKKPVFDLAENEYRFGRALIVYPDGYDLLHKENIYLRNTSGIVGAVETAFTFRDHLLDEAKRTLNKIVQDHKTNLERLKKKKKKFTFVGIHSRRTDHLSLEKERGHTPLTFSYYLDAMDMYRQKFKNCIFVYISDDLQWGEKSMRYKNKHHDIYFAGIGNSSDVDSVGHDLALMSLMNHTILSFGTFSYWAGFLAGGSIIMPQHFPLYRGKYRQEIFKKDPLEHPLERMHPYVI